MAIFLSYRRSRQAVKLGVGYGFTEHSHDGSRLLISGGKTKSEDLLRNRESSTRNEVVVSPVAQQPLTLSQRARLNLSSCSMTGTSGWIVTRILPRVETSNACNFTLYYPCTFNFRVPRPTREHRAPRNYELAVCLISAYMEFFLRDVSARPSM